MIFFNRKRTVGCVWLLIFAFILGGCGKQSQSSASTTEAAAETSAVSTEVTQASTQATEASTQEPRTVTDYTQEANWAFYADGEGDADVFFVAPTSDMKGYDGYNISLANEKAKSKLVAASVMELGIYNENAVVYAPYYQQAAYPAYLLPEAEAAQYLDIAYADVKAAFELYQTKCDKERPLILAGFSQGADMIIRLLKDFGNDSAVADRLVAAYALGWHLTKEEVEEYPWLTPAAGENDTGCIVIINSEAEAVNDSPTVPAGTWTYSINPLNWKTDSTPADASLNLGACFLDSTGAITSEIPAFTGAVIDSTRGTLKCPDVDSSQYTSSYFEEGVYHLYDYQFFYRNLQKNVSVRLQAWEESRQ